MQAGLRKRSLYRTTMLATKCREAARRWVVRDAMAGSCSGECSLQRGINISSQFSTRMLITLWKSSGAAG